MLASSRFTNAIVGIAPGVALDLACGSGRHSLWLQERGWRVTAVDREPGDMPSSITVIVTDLENQGFVIAENAWDLIVCWLYWQPDLLGSIRRGVRPGGVVVTSGKIAGRFASSLDNYRQAFTGWDELEAGTSDSSAWFIGRKPLS